MKKANYILFLSISMLTLNACVDDFLTVTPKTDITTEDFFNSETGFKDALTGVYIRLKTPYVYGDHLSMSTIEYLVSNWDMQSNSTPQYISRWDYSQQGVERTFNEIFTNLYRVISRANAIIDKIDENQDVFITEGLYEMIKGEALAIRAYCHFDVLRLFGPVPGDTDPNISLPYASKLSRDPVPHLSLTQFRQQLISDLQAAENLLRNSDPIVNYSIEAISRPGVFDFNPSDNFLSLRNIRMNYFAVKALQARAHLWFGNAAEAYDAAREVINATNDDGSDKFRLASASDFASGDFIMTSEHIFGLHEFSLPDRYAQTFGRGIIYRGLDDNFIRNQLYGNTGTDIREANLWEIIATNFTPPQRYVIKKYKMTDGGTNFMLDYRRIPLLRLSEMYLIAIEAASRADAQAYWDVFAMARNVTASELPPSMEEIQNMILHEYRKEFYAEGQAFYAYKRLNVDKNDILWAPLGYELNYVVPLPLTEIIQTN